MERGSATNRSFPPCRLRHSRSRSVAAAPMLRDGPTSKIGAWLSSSSRPTDPKPPRRLSTRSIALATESGADLAVITVWRALQGDYGLTYPSAALLDDLLEAERRHAEVDAPRCRRPGRGVPACGSGPGSRRAILSSGSALTPTRSTRVSIAVGTRGHGSVASLILGSVSNGVIRNASRPVLVVRVRNGETGGPAAYDSSSSRPLTSA